MKNKLLLRTNFLLCGILALGFTISSFLGMKSYEEMFKKNIEAVGSLTSESIFHQINSHAAQPLSISTAMSDDRIFENFLATELPRPSSVSLSLVKERLKFYKEHYGFASAFLVSSQTDTYYHFSGRNHVLEQNDSENEWYYYFKSSPDEYSFGEGTDPYEGDMYFVDCKIYDDNGNLTGIVGLGFLIENLQELLQSYNREYDINLLVTDVGSIAAMAKGEHENLLQSFKSINVSELASIVEETGEGKQTVWKRNFFIVSAYIPSIRSYLVIENNIEKMRSYFNVQLICGICVTILIALVILLIFNKVILSYNGRLLELVVSQEVEHYALLSDAIKNLYPDVLEFDLTHRRAYGENTKRNCKTIGLKDDADYREIVETVMKNQVKEEFRESFLNVFTLENVIERYSKGETEIKYDCMMNTHWDHYNWVQLQAQLFYYMSDESIHMILFSRDINDEKERERRLLRMAETDSLTGLYNKNATKRHAEAALTQTEEGSVCALIITDIDYFKSVNDTFGHAVGDRVIKDFAKKLKRQFRDVDICGRIGGDEFAVLMRDIPGGSWLTGKMEKLAQELRFEVSDGRRKTDEKIKSLNITASIGVACYPQNGMDFDTLYKSADAALYKVKENGRNGFLIS
ncbi:MAG: sensor domain-containing diguanylate cyclase [Clostridiales bacterium]|jgi:diguanylate cyclase (GGDEF)-like protein|nr:sensor domain-containing diguanylate cyclase [Clostridiales bacterium]